MTRACLPQSSRITTADLVVKIDLDPFHVSFTSPDRKVYLRQAGLERGVTGTPLNLPLGASRAGDRLILHESFACAPDEHFYGFGEKFTNFDKRGQWLAMWNDDAHGVNTERAYKNVPFFVSSKGYGLFVDSVTYVNFDMGQPATPISTFWCRTARSTTTSLPAPIPKR